MDSLLTPCTLCSTYFQTQFPSAQKQVDRKAAKDVVFVSGLYGPPAQDFRKYLEDGLFCPACNVSIASLHSNMSLIRQLQQNVHGAWKVIQDGIDKSCEAWCKTGGNVGGLGQFFLDPIRGVEGPVDEEMEEIIRLEHEVATSVFTGSGWSADEEEESSNVNLNNVQEIDPRSSTSVEPSGYKNVTLASTFTAVIPELPSATTSELDQGQTRPLDLVKTGFIKPAQFACYPCGLVFKDHIDLGQHSQNFHGAGPAGTFTKEELIRRSQAKERQSKSQNREF